MGERERVTGMQDWLQVPWGKHVSELGEDVKEEALNMLLWKKSGGRGFQHTVEERKGEGEQ